MNADTWLSLGFLFATTAVALLLSYWVGNPDHSSSEIFKPIKRTKYHHFAIRASGVLFTLAFIMFIIATILHGGQL